MRRPRTQQVWNETYHMGNILDGFGPNGRSPEGLSKDLTGVWDYLWGHGVDADLYEAEIKLRQLGSFLSSSLY